MMAGSQHRTAAAKDQVLNSSVVESAQLCHGSRMTMTVLINLWPLKFESHSILVYHKYDFDLFNHFKNLTMD